MTPEQTFEQLLGLGTSWKVIRTEFETERNTFVICVETEALWPEESAKCGQRVTCYDHGGAAIVLNTIQNAATATPKVACNE